MNNSNSFSNRKRVLNVGGVTEFQYRRSLQLIRQNEISTTTTLDAAALQLTMARRYQLTNGVARLNPTNSRTAAVTDLCSSCHSYNSIGTLVCQYCGFYTNSVREIPDTLAQKRGLEKKSEKIVALITEEWRAVEDKFKIRNDATCPICMEYYTQGEEILLSCSHLFHKACIHSFEKFMKHEVSTCPICRHQNYQKKSTNLGTKSYSVVCALKLQALWRGYKDRQRYRILLKSHYKKGNGNEIHRKKFYEQEFSIISQKMNENMSNRSLHVDQILSSMDRTLEESKQLDSLFEAMMNQRAINQSESILITSSSSIHYPPPRPIQPVDSLDDEMSNPMKIDWKVIHAMALRRDPMDCPICMLPIQCHRKVGITSNKKNVLLSCSHVFHATCLHNFEQFIGIQKFHCPVCRSEYCKVPFD